MSGQPPEILMIPSEFAPLPDGNYREAIVEGGRYSLKSHSIARIILIWTMAKKNRVLCGREFQNSISESMHQLFFTFKGARHDAQSIKAIARNSVSSAWSS